MAEEMNANESGLNMGVLADIASLASEKNVSDETVRSLNEKVPGADKADQAEKNGGAVPQKRVRFLAVPRLNLGLRIRRS